MKLLTFEHNGKETLGVLDDEGMVVAHDGWKTLKEVQRYTQTARKRVLSNSALERVQADIDGTNVSNLPPDGSKVRQ